MATINGTAGNDTRTGTASDDTIYGLAGNDDLFGEAGDDLLLGGAGNDLLDGGAGRDALTGGEGNDRLLGGADNDVLDGGAGNDQIDGGAGVDVAVFAGRRDDFEITTNGGTTFVRARPGREGNDVLTNVERLRFDDTTVFLTPSGGPAARPDANSVTEDATLVATGNLLSNDSDPDGDPLTLASVNGTTDGAAGVAGTYGRLTFNADGSYAYTLDNGSAAVQALNAGESVQDQFAYTVSDGQGGTSASTLTVTVNGANDAVAPDAANDAAAVRANASVTIDVLANDADANGDALMLGSISGLDAAPEGTAQITNNQVVFTPAPAFAALPAGETRDVVFSYTARDPSGLSDTAEVAVTVVGTDEGTQTDTTNGTLANGQAASISLTTEARTIDGTTDIRGTINLGNLATQKFNVVFVVDVSGSTEDPFSGAAVGDQNRDGRQNTILDAEIASLRALTQEIVDRGFRDADVDIGLVSFSTGAFLYPLVYKPSEIIDGRALDSALEAFRPVGATDYEAGLQRAITFLNNQPDRASANNLVFFLSDGVPGPGNQFADEAATLKTLAQVNAVGLGGAARLEPLNQIDNTGGAQLVDSSDDLAAALQNSPLTPATITNFELVVDGTPVPGVTRATPTGGPNLFNYAVQDAAGLEVTDDDTVLARVTFSDGTVLSVDTVVDGRDLSIFGV